MNKNVYKAEVPLPNVRPIVGPKNRNVRIAPPTVSYNFIITKSSSSYAKTTYRTSGIDIFVYTFYIISIVQQIGIGLLNGYS